MKPVPPVRGKGRMTPNGYEPENHEWHDVLVENASDPNIFNRIGRDPMALPTDILTAAGHPPRRTSSVVAAMDESPKPAGEVIRHKHIRRFCLNCAENAAEIRRCIIINCPAWQFRMGKNPHDARRGTDPFKNRRSGVEPC